MQVLTRTDVAVEHTASGVDYDVADGALVTAKRLPGGRVGELAAGHDGRAGRPGNPTLTSFQTLTETLTRHNSPELNASTLRVHRHKP